MILISLLIPTLNEIYSIRMLKRLRKILDPQVEKFRGQVEIKVHDAGRSMTTGEKRNQLIANSSGEYFAQIDCDDIVADYYVEELMTAIQSKPDVVTFNGKMTTNGGDPKRFEIRLGSGYYETKACYYRFPNHLTCIRRDAIKNVRFPNITNGEDYAWAKEIHDKGLLKTSVHIEKDMYTYEFVSHKYRK